MSEQFGTLTRRSVHPASPVLLTKNGPLRTLHSSARVQLSNRRLLTYLKFENRLRVVSTPRPLIIRFT